jgi:aryl-alcohol dehydrogenase-like predicted oxidoreductase
MVMELAGIEVSRIGLGTNRLTNTRDNVAFIRSAVAAGVQLIDTAHLYTGGHSEETVGAALAPAPDNVIVATKGGYNSGAARVLRVEIEQSLRSLRTERIALYYLHRADVDTPMETSLKTIKEYVDRGVIGHVGLSQVNVEQVERARKVAPIAAVQCRYNLADRTNDPVVDYCEREGIAFVPFYPLRDGGGGSALGEIARRHKATPHQVMLAWLLKRSPVVVPIPGTLSLEHLKENVAAQHVELSDQEFEALS